MTAAEPTAPIEARPATSDGQADGATHDRPVRLIARDGQLEPHVFTVFVANAHIEPGMRPGLRLGDAARVESLAPRHVAPGQTRTVMIDGTEQQADGTLLVFDLGPHAIPLYKSARRLSPIVEWTSAAKGTKHVVVAEREVYLGNLPGALLWTGATVLVLAIVLLRWSRTKSRGVKTFTPRPWLLLITGPDGYFSLWRVQLLLWTFAVGGFVFMFGLTQLQVPAIPGSLVALMGLSLLTGVTAKAGQRPAVDEPAASGAAAPVAAATCVAPPGSTVTGGADETSTPQKLVRAEWADLISTWNEATKQVELSLPKAQMVLWTVLIMGLFCVKSILGGDLWTVPWEMVALTGFSQAGYVGDKFVGASPPVSAKLSP